MPRPIISDIADAPDFYSLRAGWQITGGGIVFNYGPGGSGEAARIGWSQRFIAIAQGMGADTATAGYFDVALPANGTVITGVGGGITKTVAGGYVPIGQWESLYYILPLGSSNPSVPGNFRLVSYVATQDIPPSWVRIAAHNTDDNLLYVVGRGAVDYWHTPTFAAGASYWGAPYNTCAFKKDGDGFVHLRGLVGVSVVGGTIFTLPASYRPIAQELMGTIANSGIGRVDVTTGGAVLAAQGTAAGWWALDGLTFFASG